MKICEDCKEKECIDTTCRTCWPKEDDALYHGLMSGDKVEFKPDRRWVADTSKVYYPDDKGML